VILLLAGSGRQSAVHLVWTLFGATVRPFLAVRWIRRVFNALMSALILATAWWMLRPLLAH
jgi:hypothetical protein